LSMAPSSDMKVDSINFLIGGSSRLGG